MFQAKYQNIAPPDVKVCRFYLSCMIVNWIIKQAYKDVALGSGR